MVYLILKHIQICSIYIEPMILGPSSFFEHLHVCRGLEFHDETCWLLLKSLAISNVKQESWHIPRILQQLGDAIDRFYRKS